MGLTALFFFPALPQFSNALIGPAEDKRQFFWFIWHGSQALADKNMPLMRTAFIYYPEGVSLYYANYAMGAYVHVLGRIYPMPLPYRLIQEIPFFENARNPSRIMVYAYIFLAILTAFSVKKIFERPFRFKKIAGVLIFLAVFTDFYSVSFAMTPVRLPKARS